MNQDSLQIIIDTLNGRGIELSPYPEGGLVTIQGFYYNGSTSFIEHWSVPCEYTRTMVDHFSNSAGLVRDGFQSIEAFEDIDALTQSIAQWNSHLIKYGVKE